MEVLVVGAGVIGLATARALAMRGHGVVIAEATNSIGNGVSSRNSEVIHGGMYYPTGSLRQIHCVAGKHMLYAYCEAHHVRHSRCGKLIVATSASEVPAIEGIYAQGVENGLDDLRLLEGAEARGLEPALACETAVLSPSTGVIDSHGLMLALQGDVEDAGGMIAFGTTVRRAQRDKAGWNVTVGDGSDDIVQVDAIVNAAGLGAQTFARTIEGYPGERVPRLVLAKGNYFAMSRRAPFSRLIYPAPVKGGLGTHLTIDLAGQTRFGPDVEWTDVEDYEVSPGRAHSFYESIRRYWPDLPDGTLTPDYAGIRPKLSGPGEPAADFVIDGPGEHGIAGLVNLFGIESPGLTSSLSIAEAVAERLVA